LTGNGFFLSLYSYFTVKIAHIQKYIFSKADSW